MKRSAFVAGAAAGLASWGVPRARAAGAVPRTLTAAEWPQHARPLVPVQVSLDRVTRTTVGLRPYRASGFVVRAEGRDEQTIIHNYGHGGGGMTLSWGTAVLAAELAIQSGKNRSAGACVLGCGVIGLTTALALFDAGFDVTIVARDLPPNTTSNMSGAQWSPTSVFDPARVDAAFRAQYVRAAHVANRRYQTLLGDDYGVRWIENYDCRDEDPNGFLDGAAISPIRDLYPEAKTYGPGEHPFPTRYATRFLTMLIEPNRYLRALVRDVLTRGIRIHQQVLTRETLFADAPWPLVVNCTGLGAKELFGDGELEPVRGQLSVLAPQPAVDYITLHGGRYMFPRSDGVVLGGTFQHGDADLAPDPATERQIVAEHAAFFAAMKTR